ncbi:hypothetical protein D3C74_49750 [compost metagenome]
MKANNRKKLATIKRKILDGQFSSMAKSNIPDDEFETALQILGDAMMDIEKRFGDVD